MVHNLVNLEKAGIKKEHMSIVVHNLEKLEKADISKNDASIVVHNLEKLVSSGKVGINPVPTP